MDRWPISGYLRGVAPFVRYFPPDDPLVLRFGDERERGYTDADVFKLIYVDPAEIRYCSRRGFEKWRYSGTVRGGEWDRSDLRFEDASFYDGLDVPFYGSMVRRFDEGVEWEETEFVEAVIERVRSGRPSWGCFSVHEVREKYRRLDRIYERIATEGYKPQRIVLLDDASGDDVGVHTKALIRLKRKTILAKDEVAVDIGRDGELLYYDGKHRLSIAKLLGLDAIPVRVVVRHSEWQDVRDSISEDGDRLRYRNHPDLVDLRRERRRPGDAYL